MGGRLRAFVNDQPCRDLRAGGRFALPLDDVSAELYDRKCRSRPKVVPLPKDGSSPAGDAAKTRFLDSAHNGS
jgi:hypothetical protein